MTFGQYCPTLPPMRGNTFAKKVARLANEHGIECRVGRKRGMGSHVTLCYGARRAVPATRRTN